MQSNYRTREIRRRSWPPTPAAASTSQQNFRDRRSAATQLHCSGLANSRACSTLWRSRCLAPQCDGTAIFRGALLRPRRHSTILAPYWRGNSLWRPDHMAVLLCGVSCCLGVVRAAAAPGSSTRRFARSRRTISSVTLESAEEVRISEFWRMWIRFQAGRTRREGVGIAIAFTAIPRKDASTFNRMRIATASPPLQSGEVKFDVWGLQMVPLNVLRSATKGSTSWPYSADQRTDDGGDRGNRSKGGGGGRWARWSGGGALQGEEGGGVR